MMDSFYWQQAFQEWLDENSENYFYEMYEYFEDFNNEQ